MNNLIPIKVNICKAFKMNMQTVQSELTGLSVPPISKR